MVDALTAFLTAAWAVQITPGVPPFSRHVSYPEDVHALSSALVSIQEREVRGCVTACP